MSRPNSSRRPGSSQSSFPSQTGQRIIHTMEPQTWFKFVAVEEREGGERRYVSIYDGQMEYQVGSMVSEEVRAGHKGGIYVCRSVLDLLKLGPLPSKSRHMDSPWAICRMVGWGQMIEYNEDSGGTKVALSNVVPLQFVDFPEEAKLRFMRRSRRVYSSARRQREGEIPMRERVMAPTPEELQEVYQDWVRIMGEMEEEE